MWNLLLTIFAFLLLFYDFITDRQRNAATVVWNDRKTDFNQTSVIIDASVIDIGFYLNNIGLGERIFCISPGRRLRNGRRLSNERNERNPTKILTSSRCWSVSVNFPVSSTKKHNGSILIITQNDSRSDGRKKKLKTSSK